MRCASANEGKEEECDRLLAPRQEKRIFGVLLPGSAALMGARSPFTTTPDRHVGILTSTKRMRIRFITKFFYTLLIKMLVKRRPTKIKVLQIEMRVMVELEQEEARRKKRSHVREAIKMGSQLELCCHFKTFHCSSFQPTLAQVRFKPQLISLL